MEFYKQSEFEAAEDFEGHRVAYSGAREDKGDIVTGGKYDGYIIENKATKKDSYSIKFKYFKEQERQARIQGKKFFMRIDDTKNKPLILIDQELFKELLSNA